MVVILDELTPVEFFSHGGIVKLEVDDWLVKELDLKKKYTFFMYKDYIRFFNSTYISYIHQNPMKSRDRVYDYINSHLKTQCSIGIYK